MSAVEELACGQEDVLNTRWWNLKLLGIHVRPVSMAGLISSAQIGFVLQPSWRF
jgi:hypothetical protein